MKLLELFRQGGLEPLVVVAAHPDDETVGAGARLPALRRAFFLYVTDGAPRDGRDARAHGMGSVAEYARARWRELEAALALAGVPRGQARCLGLADQEAGLHLGELTRLLAEALRALRPRAVLTHPYEGGHPDHDATAFAVRTACGRLAREGRAPAVLEMTSYHNGPYGLTPGEFLPGGGPGGTLTLPLTEGERKMKRGLLDCFATQRETLRYFPVELERFRVAPRYDFRLPPHPGPLFYEGFPWGLTGRRFRELAAAALETG